MGVLGMILFLRVRPLLDAAATEHGFSHVGIVYGYAGLQPAGIVTLNGLAEGRTKE